MLFLGVPPICWPSWGPRPGVTSAGYGFFPCLGTAPAPSEGTEVLPLYCLSHRQGFYKVRENALFCDTALYTGALTVATCDHRLTVWGQSLQLPLTVPQTCLLPSPYPAPSPPLEAHPSALGSNQETKRKGKFYLLLSSTPLL